MFIVFAGDHYYPLGGWSDFNSRHTSLDDAKCSIEVIGGRNPYDGGKFKIDGKHYDWYQIVNARTLKVVEEKW